MESSDQIGIADKILRNAAAFPNNPALTVDGQTWTYQALVDAAFRLASLLPMADGNSSLPVTAILAHRAESAYIGILACIFSGNTYVPIYVNQPVKRTLDVLIRSGAKRLITCEQSDAIVKGIFAEAPHLQSTLNIIDYRGNNGDSSASLYQPRDSDTAYILFTSGSTGIPKGVPISHRNLRCYLEAVAGIMDVRPTDRFSQTFELTFDPSIHDMFVCWTNAAHLIVATPEWLKSPADFIIKNEITCWFSVPSLAYQIEISGRLNEGAFPSLRWSLFAGEALPADIALKWLLAAKSSRVHNWYGPTEATITCCFYEVERQKLTIESKGQLIPIGKAFYGMEMLVYDENLNPVADETPGELLLYGGQVANGYLNDPEKTRHSFVNINGKPGTCYRTGDRVIRDNEGNIRFLGRIDNQIKVRGFRVELGDVEAAVREACPVTANIIAIPWPPDKPSATTVIVAFEAREFDTGPVLAGIKQTLPDYMIPSRFLFIPEFPKNPSGKADRAAIAAKAKQFFLTEENSRALADLTGDEKKLMADILEVSPHLAVKQILQAETLFAAGMDSLSFIKLSIEIEKNYGVTLSHVEVNQLAEMSFHRIISQLTGADTLIQPATLITPENTPLQRRANRAMQFIERFPDFLDRQTGPFVFVVGSSGIFMGFSPTLFDSLARAKGYDYRSVNIGLPAINCQGIRKICDFIVRKCQERDIRSPLIIYELDPMHLSVLPPGGDIGLQDKHFSGKVRSFIDDQLDPEFSWQSKLYGAGQFKDKGERPATAPNWQQLRKGEVARTFLGQVDFRQQALSDWIEGAKLLSSIADKVIGFIHPVDNSMLSEVTAPPGLKLESLLTQIQREAGISFLRWDEFDLDEVDFLDFNHANSWSGIQKLTRQIAEKCL